MIASKIALIWPPLAKEIAFAVVAMSLTLAAVFAPLGFMTGNTGRLFTEFALTVAAAVVVSGIVGYLTVKYFLRFLTLHSLDAFAVYRLLLAAATIVWLML